MTHFTGTVDVLRHGHASAHEVDAKRQLSTVGIRQAANRRCALGYPEHDLVLVSPTERTVGTGLIIASAPSSVLEVEQLYCEPTSEAGKLIDAMFGWLGYVEPSKYYEEPYGYILQEHGELAWKEVMRMAQASGATRILVVGHAVLANAMGHAAIGDEHVGSAAEFFKGLWQKLDFSLGECQGFRLHIADGKVADAELFQ